MRFLDAVMPAPRAQFAQPMSWEFDDQRLPLLTSWGLTPDREPIPNDFEGYVTGVYQSNGVVFACITARQLVFSEATFQWREKRNGRPGALFGNRELALLERPWPGGTTGELLARMEADVSLAGNFYATTVDDRGRYGNASRGGKGRRIARMRPDWVTLILGSRSGDPYALDTKVIAYQYWPNGLNGTRGQASDALLLLPNEVAHFSPTPDPLARFRGMSWLTPVLREVASDKSATKHKLKYFENASVPNFAVSLPKEISPDNFRKFVDQMDSEHKGSENWYKTLYLAGGADVTVLGANMQQLDLKNVTGLSETRIAAAARVHPVVVGLSEGLSGSSLNAGNYNSARRSFADGTMRPLWRIAAASLENLLEVPAAAHLWYDDRDVAFLREDAKDQAEIQQTQAQAIRTLLDAGYEPDAAVEYVQTGDLSRLTGNHSGLYSVQLLAPNQGVPELPAPDPAVPEGKDPDVAD